ncbi:MAG TPA: efflux transporter outer membrane subunit, partial [Caulobacteraceae bacterium]|nr:efflux transporter outer membrane subunit [Caulobacteraceae bacterium]
LLGLGGCVVGPNYQAPAPPVGASQPWRYAEPSRETSSEPPDDWWRLYDDPKLDAYVAEAFDANHDLAAAEANLASSRAILEAARAGRLPGTTADFGAIYGRDPATDEILGIVGRPHQTVWKFDDFLDVSYELDLFGHVRRSIEASRADAEATAAARDAVKVTVAAETTRAYVSICVSGEQLAVAQRSLAVVTRQLDITERRKAAGAATDFDIVRAQLIASQVRATIPPLEGQRRAALLELTALIGKTPAYAPREALGCVAPPRLQASIPVGDGAGLLRRRPDIREAERRLAADTARVGVATAELYPRISLVGSYGGASGDINALTLERGLAWGVGPSISWSFPNQAGPRARVRASKADAAATLQALDSTVLRALKETEQALTAYGAELDRRQALEAAQAQAHHAFDLARVQVADGAASSLDLLTSEQQMVAADATLANSDGDLVQDQIGVFKALGGGWQGRRQAANSP